MSVKPVRILVIGTGDMAEQPCAPSSTRSRACKVVAGVDIAEARLKEFCEKHKIPRYFTDLDEAIAWGEFDAVTNVTPDAVHHPTTMTLVAAGKPMLCEKPLAPSYPLALEMTEAAKKARRRRDGEPPLSRAAGDADGARAGRGRDGRRDPPHRRRLPAELAGRHALGRLAHARSAGSGGSPARMAAAACSATSASTSSTSPPTSPTRSRSRCIAA